VRTLKIILATWFCVFGSNCFGQNTPQLVRQVNLGGGLDEILSSSSQNTYLVISGDKYTLIDQTSKIQLGTLVFGVGSWAAQGVGKTVLWGDSSILISTAKEIMIADPVTGKIDTFFNATKFPEIIEGFTPYPGDENKILIHTKTYSEDGVGNITPLEKGENIRYKGARNCKLYLYNGITKQIEYTNSTPYLFTAFSQKPYKKQLLAGTLKGDIIQIDSALNQQKLFHAFDTTVHSIIPCDEHIAAIPTSEDRFVTPKARNGASSVYFFKNGTKERVITFEKQEPSEIDEFSSFNPSPSADIFRAFFNKEKNHVLVNYGFNGLAKISLHNFAISYLPTQFNTVRFYCLDKDKTKLLGETSDKQSVFTTLGSLNLYDVGLKHFLPVFKEIQAQQEAQQLYKTYDEQGNYHIIAYQQDYNSDTVIIYSSNKTQPTTIGCKWCKFTINTSNNTLGVKSYNVTKVLKLPFSKLQNSLYTIEKDKHPNIFKQIYSTESIDREKRITSVKSINLLSDDNWLIVSTYYKNDATPYRVSVVNNKGEFLFDKKGFAYKAASKLIIESPSKKYIAISYTTKISGKEILEVWDWQANKKVFAKKFKKKEEIRHFTFDKTQDVLWYSNLIYYKNLGYSKNFIYSINLNKEKATPVLQFEDDRYFSFEIDMQNDRVAIEAYDQLFVAQLSTQKTLWKHIPQGSSFTPAHLPNGFSFSSKTELYTYQNNSNNVYFTTFSKNKAVEVANNYLYKGNKSAINNLAFVYKRKGFLPADYDLYFNRPDKVLQLSGSKNEEYNALIKEAQAKRSRKAASVTLNELLTQSPKLEISNKAQLPTSINKNSITLNIESQSKNAITHLHIIANGVPIYGERGLALKNKSLQSLSQNIVLQTGNNTLQVYVEDEKGIISPTETVNIVANYNYTPKTYFIGIGIDKFLDSNQNLSYSVKDIYDLKNALKAKLDTQLVSYMFANEDVKVANITHLNSVLEETNVNDKVIISYSGHGLLNKKFDYYLSTTNIDFRRPEKNGLPYKALEKLLDSIPARQKLLFIDACHSGEVDKEAIKDMKVVFGDTTNKLKQGGKSGIELLVDESTVGLKNSFELMQELFVDVGRGTGTNIISAVAGTQVAYEKGDLKNGVFTYCILQMLKDHPNCTVQQLKEFVSTEVERITNGLQKPTSRNEVVGFNWTVW
jgi:hypothetical protein